MPFTPFHWGPSSALGISLRQLFDLPTLLVACVIVDIEPFCVLTFGLPYPLHGFFHSFLGASLAGVAVALAMNSFKKPLRLLSAPFKLAQESSFLKILGTSLFGVYSHVLLDAPLYHDIRPFYPLEQNPFYQLFKPQIVYRFCALSFGVALLAYVIRLMMPKKATNQAPTKDASREG